MNVVVLFLFCGWVGCIEWWGVIVLWLIVGFVFDVFVDLFVV